MPEPPRSYLALPESGRRQLAEQLQLIQEGVQEALRLDHAAANRVLPQGRFLGERFQVLEEGLALEREKS